MPHVSAKLFHPSAGFFKTNTAMSRCIVYLNRYVFLILFVRGFTKIGESVVSLITINVVKLIHWKLTIRVQPRKSMSDV